ncbi:MAG TPA: GH116 family glycosyl-hydrolase, partial [bacterium]|nr:GH116 family glycosyl-hydrolase [bacterium]
MFSATFPTFATTNIPTQAWSRDINAGGYIDGAPVGGFGAGTMTWDFAGDFYLDRLNIASGPTTANNPAFAIDANCHFYMYQKVSGQTAVVKMLNAATLGSGEATYSSLFPKSWVSYSGATFPLPTTVTQFSPIMPQTVMASAITLASYPEAIYEWDVTNSQAVTTDFAVMLTFDNSFGGTNAAVTTSGINEGLVLTRNNGNAANQNQGEFTLATQTGTGVTVTYESAASVATLQAAFS